jgi:hypothetical protein
MTQLLSSSEETAQHSTTEITRQPTSRKRASSNIRSLAKLVAARKGKCIRNSKHNRNNCSPSTSAPISLNLTANNNLPTKLNQIKCNLKIATIPSATQLTGCEYNANQKNRLSVALICLASGSADSKTQLPSPDCAFTSFHQRRPTKRLPAMFLR